MRFTLLAAAAAVLALQGCGADGTAPRGGDPALLRLASTSPDAGALDLLVNGRTVASGVGSTRASAAAEVDAGRAAAEIRATGSAAALASLPLTLEAGRSYTVLASGPARALSVLVSVDTSSGGPAPVPPPVGPVDSGAPRPPVDAARFRLVHAAPDAPPLDPYLTAAGAELDSLPTLQPFAYGSLALTADLIRPPGRYTVSFTEGGTARMVLSSGPIDAAAGELVTVVLGENADRSLRVDVVRE